MEEPGRTLRLTHPDLAGEQEVGVDTDPRKAIEKALRSLGERRAREMAEGADLDD